MALSSRSMKYSFAIVCLLSSLSISCTCSRKEKSNDVEAGKRSYYVGVSLAQSVDSSQGYDMDKVLEGFKDGLEGAEGIPSKEELQAFYLEEQQRRYQQQNVQLLKNEEAAKLYLQEVSAKENLVATGTGVFYKITKPGQGDPIGASDKMVVKYKGFLPDGKVFEDRSKTPVTASLMEVVPGWRVLGSLFKAGSQITIYLSPQQAYGIMGKDLVPPMSAVKFEVEVVNIIRQPQKKIRL